MYIKKKEMPNSFGRFHICLTIAAHVKGLGGYFFYSLSFFFRKESNAITVPVTVAIQVTTAITNSKVIDKPP